MRATVRTMSERSGRRLRPNALGKSEATSDLSIPLGRSSIRATHHRRARIQRALGAPPQPWPKDVWRRVRGRSDWQDAMKQLFEKDMWLGRDDPVLSVGKQEQHPGAFLVLGVFWPPAGPV